MIGWYTELQGSTVLGPHRDYGTGGHNLYHLTWSPPPGWHPVGLFSQVPGVKFTASDKMIDRGMAGEHAQEDELGLM